MTLLLLGLLGIATLGLAQDVTFTCAYVYVTSENERPSILLIL